MNPDNLTQLSPSSATLILLLAVVWRVDSSELVQLARLFVSAVNVRAMLGGAPPSPCPHCGQNR
ncbi:hypothetical protein [Nocardia salmonicida]|uniref:hypothetical protein n=1 Tax=Nocardia salmonicida TaxID=53431 RepID=UPI0033FB77B9